MRIIIHFQWLFCLWIFFNIIRQISVLKPRLNNLSNGMTYSVNKRAAPIWNQLIHSCLKGFIRNLFPKFHEFFPLQNGHSFLLTTTTFYNKIINTNHSYTWRFTVIVIIIATFMREKKVSYIKVEKKPHKTFWIKAWLKSIIGKQVILSLKQLSYPLTY